MCVCVFVCELLNSIKFIMYFLQCMHRASTRYILASLVRDNHSIINCISVLCIYLPMKGSFIPKNFAFSHFQGKVLRATILLWLRTHGPGYLGSKSYSHFY